MSTHSIHGALSIDAADSTPRVHCVHSDERVSLALTPADTRVDFYLRGTPGEIKAALRGALIVIEQHALAERNDAHANRPTTADDDHDDATGAADRQRIETTAHAALADPTFVAWLLSHGTTTSELPTIELVSVYDSYLSDREVAGI